MNLLGRILVVALFVLSLVFMTLAMVVYSTHRNWKSLEATAQQQLNEEKARFNTLKRESNARESQLRAEADAALQQVRKLESEARRLADDNTSTLQQLNALREDQAKYVGAVKATTDSSNKLASEVEQLRDSISLNIRQKDDSFETALKATEELQALRNDLETVLEINRQLVGDTARMTRVMEAGGLDPNAPADGVTPRVDGFVSRTQRRGGVQLVEISIGSDDGLAVNDTVEVFRNTKYKGRLEILKTSPDRSVGQVLKSFQQGPIQEGDRVATRLNLGR